MKSWTQFFKFSSSSFFNGFSSPFSKASTAVVLD
ncbi:hypothetical protein CCACVL1_01808, partial [Corchorus capsularis]